MGLIHRRIESPIINTSNQKNALKAAEEAKLQHIREASGSTETRKNPQIMGGGPIESGGDGTGFAGGISLDYWEGMIRNLPLLRTWLEREPVAGFDYPTGEQMEKAKLFHRARETQKSN